MPGIVVNDSQGSTALPMPSMPLQHMPTTDIVAPAGQTMSIEAIEKATEPAAITVTPPHPPKQYSHLCFH